MKTTQRYRHLSRSIIENISKLALISGIGFTIGTHVYMALLLAISEIPGELIWPSLIFDIFLGTGIYGLILVGGKGQRGPFIEWLAYFIPALFCIYFWNWQYEMLDTFGLGFSYFPIPSVIVLIWICLILFSAIYVIGVGIAAIVKLAQRRSR